MTSGRMRLELDVLKAQIREVLKHYPIEMQITLLRELLLSIDDVATVSILLNRELTELNPQSD